MKKILMLLALPALLAMPAAAESNAAEGLELGTKIGYVFPKNEYKNDDFNHFSAGLNAGLRINAFRSGAFVVGGEWQMLGSVKSGGKTIARYDEYGPYAKFILTLNKLADPISDAADPIDAELYAKLGYGVFDPDYKDVDTDHGKAFNIGVGFDIREKKGIWVIGIGYALHRVKPDGADKFSTFGHALNLNYTLRFGAKKTSHADDAYGYADYSYSGNVSYGSHKQQNNAFDYYRQYSAPVYAVTGGGAKPQVIKPAKPLVSIDSVPADTLKRIYGKSGGWYGK